MHDRDEFVSELLARAKGSWTAMWAALPNERRLRLASLESELGMIGRQLQLGQWKLVAERLDEFGARIEGRCDGCRYRRERRRDQVEVDVLGQFDAVRADLAAHASRRRARPTDEHRQCRVVIARRYLENHESYVDQYAEIRRRDLPVGSGEAESGVRICSSAGCRSPVRGRRPCRPDARNPRDPRQRLVG